MRGSVLRALCVALAFSVGCCTIAQSSDASCSDDFLWANNDKNQDPCTIGAWLLSPCLADPRNAVVTELYPGSETYGTPTRPDQCGCSMVYYNVIQACGVCQGGNITLWSDYQGDQCVASLISVAKYPYPIPGGTEVPAWAYIDISGTNTFDVVAAKSFAANNDTMFSATPSASSTTVSLSSSSSPSLASSTSSTSPAPSGSATSSRAPFTSSSMTQTPTSVMQASKKSKEGGIAGGTVGGVAAVALIAAALAFWLRGRARRVRRRYSSCTMDSGIVGDAQYFSSASVGLQPSDSASKVYNANDPSTSLGMLQMRSSSSPDDRGAEAASAETGRQMDYTRAAEI